MSSDVELLANVVRENLLAGSGCKRLVKRKCNEVVFACGSRADNVYFIEAGAVKIWRMDNANIRCMLGVRGAGELLAEEAVLGDSAHDCCAAMLTTGVIWAIPAASLAALCNQRPELWRMLARYILARKAEIDRRLQRLVASDVRSRVLVELVELAERIRTPDATEPTVPLSQSELAGLVGATRESTSTALNMLQREGLVLIGHRMVTLQPAAIAQVRGAVAV